MRRHTVQVAVVIIVASLVGCSRSLQTGPKLSRELSLRFAGLEGGTGQPVDWISEIRVHRASRKADLLASVEATLAPTAVRITGRDEIKALVDALQANDADIGASALPCTEDQDGAVWDFSAIGTDPDLVAYMSARSCRTGEELFARVRAYGASSVWYSRGAAKYLR